MKTFKNLMTELKDTTLNSYVMKAVTNSQIHSTKAAKQPYTDAGDKVSQIHNDKVVKRMKGIRLVLKKKDRKISKAHSDAGWAAQNARDNDTSRYDQ